MSLQEAKDHVAKSWGLKDFNEFKSQNRPPDNLIAFMESVAEQYARSKWDEACTLTNRRIIHNTKLTLADLPNKPEFKP